MADDRGVFQSQCGAVATVSFVFLFFFFFFHFWLGQTVNSLNWRRVSQSHTKDGEDYMSTASTYHPPPLMLFQ